MPTELPMDGGASPSAGPRSPAASRIVRRVHMYLGLFLAPWMFMYAISTLVMNHRELVQSWYATKAPAMVVEQELDFSRTFPPNTTPEQMGRQILIHLGLEGTHRVTGGKDGKPLVIERQHAVAPRRITWNGATGRILVEMQEFRSATFLERMHRRRGYQQPYALEDTWALSVDLAVAAMVFWSLSGLWLWWELRPTRFWGAACGSLGLAMFFIFLLML